MLTIIACIAAAKGTWAQNNQELPALYMVGNLVQEEVLQVRERPTAGSYVVGSFSSQDRNIEVIGVDDTGRWGLINLENGGNGWVYMPYLVSQEHSEWHSQIRPIYCTGNNPEWRAEIGALNSDGAMVTLTNSDVFFLPFGRIQSVWRDGGGGNGAYNALTTFAGNNGVSEAMMLLRGERCTDVKSGADYGISVELQMVFHANSVPWDSQYEGCCTMTYSELGSGY